MILQWVGIAVSIVLVDLALSGDNALVIGAVASRLERRQRRVAIVTGGIMAVILRILLAEVALFVLQVPYIQAAGGLFVLYIAVRLVSEPHSTNEEAERADKRSRWLAPNGLLRASVAILVADVTMSLDNVLAVAALARGNYVILGVGILFSMLLLLIASSLIALLIEKFPLLLYLAAGILAWTAGWMVLDDRGLAPYLHMLDNAQGLAPYLHALDGLVPGPPLDWLVSPFFLVLAIVAWLVVRAVQAVRHRKPRQGNV